MEIKIQKESKMKEIASIFGKELNEIFCIKRTGENIIYEVKFSSEGLCYSQARKDYKTEDWLLLALLRGEAIIVKENDENIYHF